MNREAIIDGSQIRTASQFHMAIETALDFPDWYGRNLDALWDVLKFEIKRPVTLIWENSRFSEQSLGAEFERIVGVLREAEKHDEQLGLPSGGRFRLVCR